MVERCERIRIEARLNFHRDEEVQQFIPRALVDRVSLKGSACLFELLESSCEGVDIGVGLEGLSIGQQAPRPFADKLFSKLRRLLDRKSVV